MVPELKRIKLDGVVFGGSAISATAPWLFLGGERKSEGQGLFSSHCSRGDEGV
jgi:hypothetical protein